jgi:hypothetical protein
MPSICSDNDADYAPDLMFGALEIEATEVGFLAMSRINGYGQNGSRTIATQVIRGISDGGGCFQSFSRQFGPQLSSSPAIANLAHPDSAAP